MSRILSPKPTRHDVASLGGTRLEIPLKTGHNWSDETAESTLSSGSSDYSKAMIAGGLQVARSKPVKRALICRGALFYPFQPARASWISKALISKQQVGVNIIVAVSEYVEHYRHLRTRAVQPFPHRLHGNLRSLLLWKSEHARADATERD